MLSVEICKTLPNDFSTWFGLWGHITLESLLRSKLKMSIATASTCHNPQNPQKLSKASSHQNRAKTSILSNSPKDPNLRLQKKTLKNVTVLRISGPKASPRASRWLLKRLKMASKTCNKQWRSPIQWMIVGSILGGILRHLRSHLDALGDTLDPKNLRKPQVV